MGRDREIMNRLKRAREECQNGDLLAIQQTAEITNGGRTMARKHINPLVLEAAELHFHVDTPPAKRVKISEEEAKNELKQTACVIPGNISNKEVKRRTGFDSLLLLMIFIVVVSNGDIDEMMTTESIMSWFEEWFLYFEMVWQKSLARWEDAEAAYRMDQKILRKVFYSKLQKSVMAVHMWPRFLTHDEDTTLRSEKWRAKYRDKRVMMWDNTNVNFMGKPSDADLQRLTYSLYYGGNVAKGGIFLQLCGWLGGWALWLGAVSDTEYFERSGLLEAQKLFQESDRSSNLSFTNILDKGYRSIRAAWRAGGQLLLQPFFAKSDRTFTSGEVLHSAAVAANRSANERAVRCMKGSGMIARGIHQRESLEMTADLWLAWGFQCNFMYKPVL